MKSCRECRVELVLDENWTFGAHKAGHYICRNCVAAYGRTHYKEHKEEIAAQARRYREANAEQIAAQHKHYRETHKEQVTATNKRWRDNHKEQIAAKDRLYRQANRKRNAAMQQCWIVANRDKVRTRRRRWYWANHEKAKTISRRASAKRRARLAGAVLGLVDEEAIFKRHSYRCVYCGNTDNLTLDHVVPVAAGGSHSEENLVVACRSCNGSKGAKELMVWLTQRQMSQIEEPI